MSEPIKILIVDDIPEKVMAIESVLEGLGQEIVKAYSGREALRKLLEHDFAVVLLDVNMPDMDGFETALMIRQRKRSEHTPIIFITAYADETHVARGYSIGAVDYIAAPIEPEVLRTKVGVFVDLYQKTETIRRQANHRVRLVREQAARQVAEAALRRSALLAEASHVMSRSLDYEETRANIAAAFVPALAEECDVHLCGVQHDPSPFELPPELTSRQTIQAARKAVASGCAQIVACGEKGEVLVLPMIAHDKLLGIVVLKAVKGREGFSRDEVGIAEEIAGRAATALDNARLYRKLREEERRKDEFLAILGHELRNPLAAITHASEIMTVVEPADPIYGEARQIVTQQTSVMKRLVDDLLDVSRVTSGRVQLQKVRTELCELAERVVEAVRPLFEERNHHLQLRIPREQLHLEVDPFRLEQILANLLINAAKYTEPGGTISFSFEACDGEVRFRVVDSGIGISPDLLPFVFDLFTQADRSPYRSKGGLGVGLTVARGLTRLHGGQLTAYSAGIGHGAEFTVQLPLIVSEACEPEVPESQFEMPHRPMRILVVEDQVSLCRMTVALLQSLGHEVSSAHDGAEAIAAVMQYRPDVVLMDIGLPDMRGYSVARSLRATLGDDTPVLVALTGYGQEEDRRRSREAGFNHHLVKPMDMTVLRHLLARIDRLSQQEPEMMAPVES